jgi:hypothetical protein
LDPAVINSCAAVFVMEANPRLRVTSMPEVRPQSLVAIARGGSGMLALVMACALSFGFGRKLA